jgi:hypothetical protein
MEENSITRDARNLAGIIYVLILKLAPGYNPPFATTATCQDVYRTGDTILK